jgi:threonine dehydrogenase-like Zn-dependent dehydrogenase
MTGIIFIGNHNLELREFSDPVPGAGQVLVQLKSSGICGSDLHFYRAAEPPEVIAGHEGAGIVAAVGENVKTVSEGKRVSVYHSIGCGTCRFCREGNVQQCEVRKGLGWQYPGTFAEYVVVPEQNCMPLPDELSFDDGAILACAGGTAYSLIDKLNIKKSMTVVVFGAGPVGLCAVMIAKHFAGRVISVDIDNSKLDFAVKRGADYTINSKEVDCVERVLELTDGRGVERVIDTSGSTEGRAQSILIADKNSILGWVGMRNNKHAMDMDIFIRKQLTLRGSYVFPLPMYPEFMKFLSSKKIHFSDIVSKQVPLSAANQAVQDIDSGVVGKYMFHQEL